MDVWLEGAQRHRLLVSRNPTIKRVEIDPREVFSDVDRSNQVWKPYRPIGNHFSGTERDPNLPLASVTSSSWIKPSLNCQDVVNRHPGSMYPS